MVLNGKQITEGTYPEVHRQDNPPETVFDSPHEKGIDVPIDGAYNPSRPKWMRKRWLVILIVVIVAVAIAVGLGVGIGVSRQRTNDNTTSGYGFDLAWRRAITSPLLTLNRSSSSSSSNSSSPPAESQHSLLDNTALTAITGSTGDRRIIFQDKNGTLRQAVFHNDKWTAPISYVIATDARSNTPLAATTLPFDLMQQEVVSASQI